MTTDQTEEQADAEALLATVRHLMSGTEIDVCERIASGECEKDPIFDDRGDLLSDEVAYSDPEQFANYPTAEEQPLFDSLRLQFYAQICNHKDGRARA